MYDIGRKVLTVLEDYQIFNVKMLDVAINYLYALNLKAKISDNLDADVSKIVFW